MEFGRVLRNLRLNRGMTQQELADAINVTVVAVGHWERGTRKPSLDAIIALSMALAVSSDVLLGLPSNAHPKSSLLLSPAENKLLKNYAALDEHGRKVVETVCLLEKERIDKLGKDEEVKVIEFKSPKSSERFIPHYATPSAAGVNAPLDGTDFEMMLVDDDVPADADYAVDIQGNSMYPYIKDGDMVYVKKDEDISVGDVGIFCVDGAMYCKQYFIDGEGNLILASANSELRHTNIVLPPDSGSSVRSCGKVILNHKVDLPSYLFEN